ncbi:hypothetical protein NC651_014691 [Populus alba x Populus x berolinensis]|nr:hypothetical protein NC651_014691 [Populus alba x Populus x berolinensis]
MHKRERKRHPDQANFGIPCPFATVDFFLGRNAPGEAAHCFTTIEIEDATKKLERKIGSGGFESCVTME